MSVKNRLKEYIKSKKKSINSFEKEISVSQGYVNNISKGIGGEILLKIIEKSPDLNINWLLTGEGERLKKFESVEIGDTSLKNTGDNNNITINQGFTYEENNENLAKQQNHNDTQISLLEKHISSLEKQILQLEKINCMYEKEIHRLEHKLNNQNK